MTDLSENIIGELFLALFKNLVVSFLSGKLLANLVINIIEAKGVREFRGEGGGIRSHANKYYKL